jgi:hypothetical protein
MNTVVATLGTQPPAAPARAAAARGDKTATWPYGPHAAAMISFNQLPSRWLHASRWAALLPPGAPPPADGDAAAHRHASALILRQLGAAAVPVTDWLRPEWALAVLPQPPWLRLLQRLALVRVQPLLRQIIRGDELRAVAQEIGADDLAWARQRAPRLPSALDEAIDTPTLAQLAQRLPQMAAGLLSLATAAAPAPMRQRLALRAPVPTPQRPDVGATRAAWALTLTLLDELEPAWRSSFPGSR